MSVKPAVLLKSDQAAVVYRERFTPDSANLQFLSCGEYEIRPGGRTQTACYPGEEALLFTWRGQASVTLGDRTYALATYDVLYVPKGQPYTIQNPSDDQVLKLFVTRAPADNLHPPFHGEFAKFSRDESRIRHLKNKEVFLMFDVGEGADKLVAGYTFFEPYARSWPPHNHTDQEEVYIFLNGRGSMEVYEITRDPEFRSQCGRGRRGDHSDAQLPSGIRAGKAAGVYLVYRRRAVLGRR